MIRYLRDCAILVAVMIGIIMVSWAVKSPTDFGKWLQEIDNARFEQTMCE